MVGSAVFAQVTRSSLLLLAFLTGCGPVTPSAHEHLANVDYWPEQQLLFLASIASGAIP